MIKDGQGNPLSDPVGKGLSEDWATAEPRPSDLADGTLAGQKRPCHSEITAREIVYYITSPESGILLCEIAFNWRGEADQAL